MINRAAGGAMLDLVSVKGFGDMVIALTCLKQVRSDALGQVRMLIGRHLQPLYEALAPDVSACSIDHADDGPAALFQARSRRMSDVLRSAVSLRRSLGGACGRPGTLVFDEFDIRHRFLALGRSAKCLPERDNLYRAWHDFLVGEDLARAECFQLPTASGNRLHIFPGAREEERRFSVDLLRKIVEHADQAGIQSKIFTVAGEMPHLSGLGLPLEDMPRDFYCTMAAVRSADLVVSADSMTAHLSEYLSKPVFVLWPRQKYFWLPLSCAERGRHALFTDGMSGSGLPLFLKRLDL